MNYQETDKDSFYEHHRFVAASGQEQLRVDKFLMNFVENVSRNKIQMAAKAGNILVNDLAVKPNYKVKPHDVVRVVLAHPPHEHLLTPEEMPLSIRYEDDDLMVVDKPAGMVVHPGHGNYSGTLINGILHHVSTLPINSSDRPGLVHRIDKDTSGLLVVAKSEFSMAHLSKQFFDHTIKRVYWALVWGDLKEDTGVIEGYIGRDAKNRLLMKNYDDETKGKKAVTYYKVMERFSYVTLVECTLETGRTHQIRAHFKSLGHPLFSDERYGGNQILKGTVFTKYKQFVTNCFKVLPRQGLHARSLGFMHPTTKEDLLFQSDLPEDMEQCIDKWRRYSKISI